jgi:lysyl-tRNA synthetase class 2
LFLDALQSGLPMCSGVALGMDRLLMLKLESADIKEVISFSIDNT